MYPFCCCIISQIFPVDENSAVCGFEAYINGKHVIGQLKLKEKAHAEYKKAIEEGQGAYLLDEGLFIYLMIHPLEKGSKFSIKIGNVPSGTHVLIKIIYVTELPVEGNAIVFVFPAILSSPNPFLMKIQV